MAALQINPASVTTQPPGEAAKADSSSFPDELHAQLNRGDKPDPGGGPPDSTAKGGASNLGPNAQSNQPDSTSQTATQTQTIAATLPNDQEESQSDSASATPIASGPAKGSSTKGANSNQIDVSLALALAGGAPLASSLQLESLASPVAGSEVESAAAVQALIAQTPTAPEPTPAPPVSTNDDGEGKLEIIVDRPSLQSAPRGLAAIPNAAVAQNTNAESLAEFAVVSTAQGGADSETSQNGSTPNEGHSSTPGQAGPDISAASAGVGFQSTHELAGAQETNRVSLPDSQRLDVVRQVADRIELTAASRPQQGVTVHLSPQGLGDVTIVVKGVGKDIEASISASNTTVRNALADSKDSLNQAVAAKGFNLVGVSVTAHSQSTNGQSRQSSQNEQQAPQNFNKQPGGNNTPDSNSSQRGPAASTPMFAAPMEADIEGLQPFPTPIDGVDYRI